MNWQKVTKDNKPTIHKWYLVKLKFRSGRVSSFPSMKLKLPFFKGKQLFWDEEHKVQNEEEFAFIKEPSTLLKLIIEEINLSL